MKAALYVRVSTAHQIDKDSLPFQKQELENYSKYLLGIEDFVIFEDAGFSGKNTDRPAYQDMMSRIRKGEFTHMLVWKLDRISRNLLDFASMYDELKVYNVTFVSKNEQFDTSSAMGEAMLKIILVFAELERKLTGERVYGIMLSRASKGLWNGANVPLGYSWSKENKYPAIDPVEASTIEYIYNVYENLKSSTLVMEQLNKEGIKTKRGGSWTTKTIADIIRNPFYKGTYRYNIREGARGKLKDEKEWIIIPNNHEGIISEDQWDNCNYIMDVNANKNTSFYRKNVNTHLFSSMLICSHCGRGMSASLDRARKDGFNPSRYRCQNKIERKPCSSSKLATDVKIGPFIFNYIAAMVKNSQSDKVNYSISTKQVTINKGYLQSEIEKEKRALDRLNSLYLYSDDAISKKDYILRKVEIENKLASLEKEIKEHQSTNNDDSFLKVASYFVLNNEIMKKEKVDYKKLVTTVDNGILKDFLNLIIDKILVDDNKVVGIVFKNGLIHRF